jgi:hypothetical protein
LHELQEEYMAAKKGEIPAHVKKKEFSHPNTQHPIIYILEGIEDPRKPSQFFRYSLTSVLFMVIAAVICGAKDWPQIVVASQGMADWLSGYVDMSEGIPCNHLHYNQDGLF